MSIRHTTKARRGAAAAALGAALALAVAGCGSGDDGGGKGDDSPQKSSAARTDDGQGETEPAADCKKVIGERKGPKNIVAPLHSAERDSGGFVTVNGTVTNRGSMLFNP